jgi:hypothetical protein
MNHVSQIGFDGATGNCSLVPFVMKRAKAAKFVTSKAEEYQRYARQCVEIAPTFHDEKRRAILLGQAQAWLRLAHLAQVNRQIAELAVQLARQRIIVKQGQRSEMAESLLDALEGSLRIFEKHRIFLLSCNASSALPPGDAARGQSWSRRNGHGAS